MNLPEPMNKQFSSLMDDIISGRLKIPQFQRDFVWDIKKSSSLLDGVVKGLSFGWNFYFLEDKRKYLIMIGALIYLQISLNIMDGLVQEEVTSK